MAEWPAYLELSVAARKCGFRETAAFGLKRIAVSRWCFVNCWIVGWDAAGSNQRPGKSLKKESTESSSSITRTIGQSEKRAAPFRKPAKSARENNLSIRKGEQADKAI